MKKMILTKNEHNIAVPVEVEVMGKFKMFDYEFFAHAAPVEERGQQLSKHIYSVSELTSGIGIMGTRSVTVSYAIELAKEILENKGKIWFDNHYQASVKKYGTINDFKLVG